MALFGSKKNTLEQKEDNVMIASTPNPVLSKPRITEKATTLMDKRVYTFDVRKGASKNEVKKAIKAQYNVDPVQVNVVNLPAKKVTRGRTIGTKGGVRKAYVYLKEGDKIDLF